MPPGPHTPLTCLCAPVAVPRSCAARSPQQLTPAPTANPTPTPYPTHTPKQPHTCSWDAPVLSPGDIYHLLAYEGTVQPDMDGGVHWNLHNNLWCVGAPPPL
jgi:hypothetical protein